MKYSSFKAPSEPLKSVQTILSLKQYKSRQCAEFGVATADYRSSPLRGTGGQAHLVAADPSSAALGSIRKRKSRAQAAVGKDREKARHGQERKKASFAQHTFLENACVQRT
jgi:hypothetical protein